MLFCLVSVVSFVPASIKPSWQTSHSYLIYKCCCFFECLHNVSQIFCKNSFDTAVSDVQGRWTSWYLADKRSTVNDVNCGKSGVITSLILVNPAASVHWYSAPIQMNTGATTYVEK